MILYLEDLLCNQIYVALTWTSFRNRSSISGNSSAKEYQWHVADASWRHALTLTSAPVLANLGLSRINRQLSLPYLTSFLSISLLIRSLTLPTFHRYLLRLSVFSARAPLCSCWCPAGLFLCPFSTRTIFVEIASTNTLLLSCLSHFFQETRFKCLWKYK